MRRMKRSGRKAEILVTVTAAVLLGAVLLLTGCAAREGGAIHPIALEAVQALTEIAAQLAVALIGVAGAWAAAKIGQQSKLSNLNAAVAQVTAAAQQTVGELQQTLAGAMKGASADGKLTAEQAAQLRQLDVSALICGAAEDAIARMKKGEAKGKEMRGARQGCCGAGGGGSDCRAPDGICAGRNRYGIRS